MKRRRLPDFETCSVALFASLARGGKPAARTAEPDGKARKHPPGEGGRHSHPDAAAAPTLLHRFDRAEGCPKDGSISSIGFDEALK